MELIPVFLHFGDNFVDSIAKEHSTVKHQNGPEYVNLEGLETAADYAHEEDEGKSLPHLHLAH